MRYMLSFQCVTHEEAQAVLAAEELLGAVREEGLRTRGVIRDKNHQP